jgi:hypothetical protein
MMEVEVDVEGLLGLTSEINWREPESREFDIAVEVLVWVCVWGSGLRASAVVVV